MAKHITVTAIKSDSGEWLLDVLAAPFGSPQDRDSDGEYFHADTKFHLDRFTPVAVHYHGFDAGQTLSQEPEYLGKTIAHEVTQAGVKLRVTLDKASTKAREIWEAANDAAQKVVASSGSLAHLVRPPVHERKAAGGRIDEWPMAEISLWVWQPGMNQANKRAIAVPALKAVYDQAGLVLPVDIEVSETSETEPEANDIGADSTSAQKSEAETGQESNGNTKSEHEDNITMDEKELQELIAQNVASAVKAEKDKEAAEREAEAARKQEIADAVKAATEATASKYKDELEAAKAEAAEARRLPSGDAPYQAKFNNIWRYDDMDAADLAVAAGVLSAAKLANKGDGVSEDMLRALAIRVADQHGEDADYRQSVQAMKMAGMPLKADELNQSTLSSYGDEWIGVTYSSQLWDKIRLATPIVSRVPTVTVPQGSESVVIPLQSTSPSFYKVAQASDQAANPGRITPTFTTSKLATANQTLTVSKLGAAVNWTRELDEDSVIPWAQELRRDLTAEAAEVLEHIVIDGDTDTSATTNINDIGGTPGGTEAFLLFNGFRKLALVTNTANSRSGGTLAVEDYLDTVKLMGLGGRNAVDKRGVEFIVDMHTHWKSMELTEIKTRDVFVAPTIENGMLTNIYGYNVVASPNMHRANQDATYGLKANTAGKVDLDTAANNTTGSILAVRYDQWRFGYKRRMTFEIDRDPIADASTIVVHMRVGMINRDNEATAISYNLTV
jgi:hypothetical protein